MNQLLRNPCVVVILACVLGGVLACRSTRSQSDAGSGFRPLIRGYHSGVTARGVRIARTEAEWQALWKEHTAHVLPRPEAPDVDWAKDMVIGVFLGSRPTAGYGVEVHSVSRQGDRIAVQAIESKPAADLVVPQVVTHPYHFVSAAKMEGEAQLELR